MHSMGWNSLVGLDHRVGGAKMLIKQSLTQRVVCQLSVSTEDQIKEMHRRLDALMQNANQLRKRRGELPFTSPMRVDSRRASL